MTDYGINDKSAFDREDRREIAYAGIVTRMLIQNNHMLIQENEGSDELKAYYKDVFSLTDGIVKQALNKLSVKKDDFGYQRLDNIKNIIAGQLKELEKPDWNSQDASAVIYFGWPFGPVGYDFVNTEEYMFYGIYSGYFPQSSISASNNKIKDDLLDKFFTKHFGRTYVYSRMKKEISYEELLKLQSRYFELYTKIAFQTEKDYDTDISFDTPFL